MPWINWNKNGFCGFIYDVSIYWSVNFEVRGQIIFDFIGKNTQLSEAISAVERESFLSILEFSNV